MTLHNGLCKSHKNSDNLSLFTTNMPFYLITNLSHKEAETVKIVKLVMETKRGVLSHFVSLQV